MRAALLFVVAVALVGTNDAFLKDTLEKAKNWFVDLGSQLKDVGGALLDSTISQAKSLLSQSVQALGGAIISSLPPNLAGKIIGRRSLDDVVNIDLAQLNARGETLKQILTSTLTDLEKLNDELLENPQSLSLEEFNAAVDAVTDRHEFAVRSVVGDALGVVADAIKAAIAKLKATVANVAGALIGKRSAGEEIEAAVTAAELMFKRAEDSIVQIAKEVGGAMKNHAADLVNSIKQKTANVKEEILSIESNMEAKGLDIAAHARSLLQQLKTYSDIIIKSTVSRLQEAGHKIVA